MIRLPPRSTRTDTLFPYTTLFRSGLAQLLGLHRTRVGTLVLLLLDAHDVGGAAVGGQQVGTVVAGEAGAKRLDPRQQAHEIVLATARHHGGAEVVAHALVAQHHLPALGEEKSAESRVGNVCACTCTYRLAPYHSKK